MDKLVPLADLTVVAIIVLIYHFIKKLLVKYGLYQPRTKQATINDSSDADDESADSGNTSNDAGDETNESDDSPDESDVASDDAVNTSADFNNTRDEDSIKIVNPGLIEIECKKSLNSIPFDTIVKDINGVFNGDSYIQPECNIIVEESAMVNSRVFTSVVISGYGKNKDVESFEKKYSISIDTSAVIDCPDSSSLFQFLPMYFTSMLIERVNISNRRLTYKSYNTISDTSSQNCNGSYIKAIIIKNNDLFELENLLNPLFELSLKKRYEETPIEHWGSIDVCEETINNQKSNIIIKAGWMDFKVIIEKSNNEKTNEEYLNIKQISGGKATCNFQSEEEYRFNIMKYLAKFKFNTSYEDIEIEGKEIFRIKLISPKS